MAVAAELVPSTWAEIRRFGVAVAVPPTPLEGGPAGVPICTPKLPSESIPTAVIMNEPFQPATEFPEMLIVSPALKLVKSEPALSSMTAPVVPVLGRETLAMAKMIGTAAPVGKIGRVTGAVYSPVELMVPKVAFPLGMPFTLHCTALLDPVTLGIN